MLTTHLPYCILLRVCSFDLKTTSTCYFNKKELDLVESLYTARDQTNKSCKKVYVVILFL